MHRSGTSLVASLLQKAGLYIGDRLVGPYPGNLHGHFEDADFYLFHEKVLHRLGQSHLVQDRSKIGKLTPAEKEEAIVSIRQRNKHPIWGWKDPRTSLFLEFWHELLPEAYYVFVYRHPVEVVLSLMRRGIKLELDVLSNPIVGLRVWETYNQAILDFYRRYPTICILAHISTVTAGIETFVDFAAEELDLPLNKEGTGTLYNPKGLKQLAFPVEVMTLLEQLASGVGALYTQLEDQADLPGPPDVGSDSPQSDPQLVALQQLAANMASHEMLTPEQRTYLFSLMLTHLAPEVVLAGKAALDCFRTEHISHLHTQFSQLRTQLPTLQQQLSDKGSLIDNLQQQLGSKNTKIDNLQQRLMDKQVQIDNLQQQLNDKDAQIDAWQQQLSDKDAQTGAWQQQLSAKDAQTGAWQQQLSAKDAQTGALQQQLNDKDAQTGALQQQLNDKDAQTGALQQQLSAKDVQIDTLQQQLSGKDAQIDTLQQQLSGKDAQMGDLQQQLTTNNARVTRLQQQFAGQEGNVKNLQRQLVDTNAQAKHLAQRINAIESTRAWRLTLKWYAFKEAVKRLGSSGFSPQTQVAASPPDKSSSQPKTPAESIFTNVVRREPTTTPAVLFISHYAGHTGAPIIFLNFLKWFKANSVIPFEILLKDDGELHPEFETLAPTIVWNKTSNRQAHIERVKTYYKQANIGLIYANTITNGDVLAALAALNCPVITHVHELEYWINYRVDPNNLKQTQKHSHHYITVSQAVKQNLVENLNIPENKISLHYEFIPTKHAPNLTQLPQIRKQLNIPPDALVVGGSGTTDWRKGPELFIQLARAIYRRQLDKPVHFVWVGGDNQGAQFGALWHDIKLSGLEHYVHFTGNRSNPLDYFANFDVFAMVSREDPFPLVNLEVASLGKPIVCFDGSGGSKEFVADNCGFVVPYLDLETMAERVVELLQTPDLRRQMGSRAAEKVRKQHDIDVVAPQILSIIERFIQ